MISLKCSNCGRYLGETSQTIDAMIFCKGCKQKVRVKIDKILTTDYFNYKEEK